MPGMNAEGSASFDRRVQDDPSLLDTLRTRAVILKEIRSFFDQRDFVEVCTPSLALTADPAVNLESFSTALRLDGNQERELFLPTSPEFFMKRMLAAGMARIFQIGPFFRNGELTQHHNPEFTGLEWYETGSDVEQLMDFTEQLLRFVGAAVGCGLFAGQPFARYSLHQAIAELGGVELPEDFEPGETRACLEQSGIRTEPTDSFDDLINRVLIERVEDKLAPAGPVFIHDYPARMAALARLRPARPWLAERFELYAGGLELCNGYGELTDASEQRARFENQRAERRRLGRRVPDLDHGFLAALEHGLPACSGCALGIDRLVMVLCGKQTIDQVMAFPLITELGFSGS